MKELLDVDLGATDGHSRLEQVLSDKCGPNPDTPGCVWILTLAGLPTIMATTPVRGKLMVLSWRFDGSQIVGFLA